MKVSIVSDDGVTVASHFGRAKGFIVYTIEDGCITSRTWRANTFTKHSQGLLHGHHETDGHKPILEALADCAVIISRGMGRRAYDDLTQNSLRVIITDATEAEKAISLFVSNQLVDQPRLVCDHDQNNKDTCG
jgi:predicted Fe-Mo cluster-binding NifX family protein